MDFEKKVMYADLPGITRLRTAFSSRVMNKVMYFHRGFIKSGEFFN
jgi:hypothetical protein